MAMCLQGRTSLGLMGQKPQFIGRPEWKPRASKDEPNLTNNEDVNESVSNEKRIVLSFPRETARGCKPAKSAEL